MQYSSFFSAGLLAAQEFPRCTTPQPSAGAPTIAPVAPSTPPGPSNSRLRPAITIKTQLSLSPSRPRLRKRRSSINVAANPMSVVKSPQRTVGASFNKALLLSPSASREVPQSFMARLVQGGIGNALRTRRRPITKPAAAPPTAPLPALPSQPPSSPLFSAFEVDTPSPGPSPAVALQRSHNAPMRQAPPRRVLVDSSCNYRAVQGGLLSPHTAYWTSDFSMKVTVPSPVASSPFMSPVDLPSPNHFDSFMLEEDSEMKEN